MITAPHTPVPFSPALEDFYLPNADRVIKVIRSML
jgi:pyruvate dehydrogenase E1 component beta subunit